MSSNQLTQMALSAIIRCKEKINLFELIDILCGKLSKVVKENGYNTIRTFGAGKSYKKNQWHYWLIQMIQQDIFWIDYDDHDYLKVSERGHQVLKGELEVVLKRQYCEPLKLIKNGCSIQIDVEIRDSINWRKFINDLNNIAYWNYIEERRININEIIPDGITERELVKEKYKQIASQVFNLVCENDIIIIPKRVDYDMYGNEVKPLSLPFEECLARLEKFVKTTKRFPQMYSLADEVALRKWYREVGHGIIAITPEQRAQFRRFSEQYQNYPKTF